MMNFNKIEARSMFKMGCDIEDNPFPESWSVYLTFGQPDDFYINLVIPIFLSLISGQVLFSTRFPTDVPQVKIYLISGIILLFFILIFTIYRVSTRTYSPSFHDLKNILLSLVGYLFISTILMLLSILYTYMINMGDLPGFDMTNIAVGILTILIIALTLISLQYRRAISGTYSDRPDVEKATATLLSAAEEINQNPDKIDQLDSVISNSSIIILEALDSAPLSDEKQLQTCLSEWLEEFDGLTAMNKEKIITGQERSDFPLSKPNQELHDQFMWICDQLRTLSH